MTDDHQAKDVFLRTFEKAFNNIERYDASKGEFSSWLNRITINEALNRIKTQSRFEFVELQEEDFSEGKLCLLYTSPSPRDATLSRMPSSA